MGYMCLFQPWFPQGICLGVGFLGHMVVLFLVFKGISIPSSIVAASIYIPTNSTEHSRFSITIFELEFWNFLGVRVKWKGAVLTTGNERPLFTHHYRNCLLTGFLPANLTPISSLLSLLQPDTHLGNLNLILSREDLVCWKHFSDLPYFRIRAKSLTWPKGVTILCHPNNLE